MLIDSRSVDDGETLTCDVCVVGAGPAGLSLVDRLRDRGLSICLLEGGGLEPDLSSQRLYAGTTVGHRYWPLHGCRFRLFGGSSNRWGGWCRPLDPLDFTKRSWVADSGWPIGKGDLQGFERDAAALLDLSDPRFDLEAWRERLPPMLDLASSDFENVVFQYSPKTNFAEAPGAQILGSPSIRTLLHANVTSLDVQGDSDHVFGVQVRTLTGRSFSVRARATVLAAGGIENARIMLASIEGRRSAVGNQHDLVGRYFMEHLHVPTGHLIPGPSALDWSFYLRSDRRGNDVRGAISPTAEAQARRELLAASIVIEPARYVTGTPFLGAPPALMVPLARTYRRLRGGRAARPVEHMRVAAEHGWHSWSHYRSIRAERFARARESALDDAPLRSLYFRTEQAPDRDNRVTLGPRRDALGVPRVELHWRLRETDTQSITGWLSAFEATLRRRGLGAIVKPPENWPRRVVGGPHHMGTTRMSSDPKRGVVDANCRVHTGDNLFVAGSSVFSTGGYANPTLTIVTLALRLADHLRDLLT